MQARARQNPVGCKRTADGGGAGNFGGFWHSLGQSPERLGKSVRWARRPASWVSEKVRKDKSVVRHLGLGLGCIVEMVVLLPTQQLCCCLIDSDISYLVALWVLVPEFTISKVGNGLSDRQWPAVVASWLVTGGAGLG